MWFIKRKDPLRHDMSIETKFLEYFYSEEIIAELRELS
jgi:hypothetical protein